MTKAQSKKLKYLNLLLKAIRERCLDCSIFNPNEVKLCGMKDCSLYPYRSGKLKEVGENPLLKNEGVSKNNTSREVLE